MFSPAAGTVSQSIPEEFPGDIPMPPDAKVQQSAKRMGMFQVELTVKEPVLSVVHFYEGELVSRGWHVERLGDEFNEERGREGGQEGVGASKDSRMFIALISPLKDGSSQVSLTVR